MCEWCGRPCADSLLCAACEERDADMARAAVEAEWDEARRVRTWYTERERQMAPRGDGSTAERPPF